MFDLNSKKALVTGATGGLGEEIARSLAAAGAKVAISGTRIERLKGLADEIGGIAIPANLSDMEEADRLAAQAIEGLGGLDILVNNAGITRDNLLMRMSEEEWSLVMKVNLEAAFRLSQ